MREAIGSQGSRSSNDLILVNLVDLVTMNVEHIAVFLDGLLEGKVVESYNSQVYYLPEH